MRITLAQLNPTVGDIAGNTTLLLDAAAQGRADRAGLVVGPELSIIGYPPRDLLWREGVVAACEEAVREIATRARGTAVIVGHPRRAPDGLRGLRNSASVCRGGEIVAVHDKRLLPGYDVFDEDRYFDVGDRACTVTIDGVKIGVLTCEDLWRAEDVNADPHYSVDPVKDLAETGCDVVVALNASPFITGKFDRHLDCARSAARRFGIAIVAVNQVGGNDDLVFDGRSFAIGVDGSVLAVLSGWKPETRTLDLRRGACGGTVALPPRTDDTRLGDLFQALVLGVRDYCRKTGHTDGLVGLSGGIDSALTATIAVAALGAEHVHGVMMPSRHSSPGSITDARALATALGMRDPEEIGIDAAHGALGSALVDADGVAPENLADENIQSRLRGLILMARSNAGGALVLATSNKSELAVGYSTIYGDMCGAMAVLGDVLKTRVYQLSQWINRNHAACGFGAPPIPEASITKPPSAELRPDQTDQDSLPPYDVLDAIIERYVEHDEAIDRIIAQTGLDADLVREMAALIDSAEYKRQQAAVIFKVSQRAFGRGRPMPIVIRQTASCTASMAATTDGA